MPRQVLGGRVHHEVRTECERLLQQRRGERVVRARKHAPRTGPRDQRGEVGDLQHGIGGALDPQQVRAGQGAEHGGGVRDVHGSHGEDPAALSLVPVGGTVVVPRHSYQGTLQLARRLQDRGILTGTRLSAAEIAAIPDAWDSAGQGAPSSCPRTSSNASHVGLAERA